MTKLTNYPKHLLLLHNVDKPLKKLIRVITIANPYHGLLFLLLLHPLLLFAAIQLNDHSVKKGEAGSLRIYAVDVMNNFMKF